MAIDISEYRRKPGSSRRYVNIKSGHEISRWEYDTVRHGGLTPRKIAKLRKKNLIGLPAIKKQAQFNSLVHAYKSATARKTGKKFKDIKVRGQSESAVEFRKLYKTLKNLTPHDLADKSANGKLAKILTQLNLRDPEWDMPVGESPK